MDLPGWIPLATLEERLMRVNWVFGAGWKPRSDIDLDRVREVAPSWGSWQSWRDCGTHNVICHDPIQTRKLLDRAFQAVCNFYIPRNCFLEVGRPTGVRLYDGEYQAEAMNIEDIVAMHMVVPISDLVLLAGINVASPAIPPDPMEQHRLRNRMGMLRSVIANNPQIQWVLVDHSEYPDPAFLDIANLTRDTMENVLKLLA